MLQLHTFCHGGNLGLFESHRVWEMRHLTFKRVLVISFTEQVYYNLKQDPQGFLCKPNNNLVRVSMTSLQQPLINRQKLSDYNTFLHASHRQPYDNIYTYPCQGCCNVELNLNYL